MIGDIQQLFLTTMKLNAALKIIAETGLTKQFLELLD